MARSENPSRYQQIAIDIAQRIVNGQYAESDKIHGRSTLSGIYQVSSETIRRAVALLSDLDVVRVHPRSGIVVHSVEKARIFIERFSSLHSIASLKNDMLELLDERERIDRSVMDMMLEIIAYAEQLKNISPYSPIEVRIEADSHAIGRTISELQFWQNTGGTVIALRHGDELTVSPGPYAVLEEGDSVVIVGNTGIMQNVRDYLQPSSEFASGGKLS